MFLSTLLTLLAWLGGATIAESQCGPSGCYVRPAPPRQVVNEAPASRLPATLRRAVVRIVHDEGAGSSVGSGALIATNERGSWFLTCAHLFDGPGKTRVVLGGVTAAARVVAIDREHDLALLQTSSQRGEPVRVAAVEPKGELAACGFGGTGVFRCVRGPVVGRATASGARFASVRIRGAVRSGDSGGPVFDPRGRLVAVIWGQRGGETYAMGGEPLRKILERVSRLISSSPRPTPPLTPVARNQETPRGCDCGDWKQAVEGRLASRPAPALPTDLLRRDDLNRLSIAWEHRFARLESISQSAVSEPPAPPTTRQSLGDWISRRAMLAALAGGAPTAAAAVLAWKLWRRRRARRVHEESQRPIAVDSPPPPQRVVPETHYVSYERDEFARAHQWACEQLARKFPGSVEMLSSLDSLIKQQMNGTPES
ncbi:hypothetical protein MalM25_34370 [Planctomycetes bacterium MalM25]|nr:hypothetical protein MalM25_34370 [Planctomycetes bacterium MalM25]